MQDAGSDAFEIEIAPQPSDDEREAILAAVRETLRREADLARPSAWRVAGWVQQRVGIAELGRWVPPARRWPMSVLFPRGGRVFPGLYGRGDAK